MRNAEMLAMQNEEDRASTDAGLPERRLLDDLRGLSCDELAAAILRRLRPDPSSRGSDESRPDARRVQ